jgi:hypothetical protein
MKDEFINIYLEKAIRVNTFMNNKRIPVMKFKNVNAPDSIHRHIIMTLDEDILSKSLI